MLCRLDPLALAAPPLHPVGHSRGSVDFRLKEWEEAQQWEDEADGPSQSQGYCCPSDSVMLGAREGEKNSVLGTRLCVWEGAMGPCGG